MIVGYDDAYEIEEYSLEEFRAEEPFYIPDPTVLEDW